MSVNRAQGFPMMVHAADGQGGSGGAVAAAPPAMSPAEAERRRQIGTVLDQGERDIAAGQGSEWADVKQRLRERISARTR
ncbi:hypothetical protein [Haliangium sp. UPWRP_2]|uniref:hypothetical protein n=1 Tax=Haliangium sp. UPWRP_2 TaxID=1931276 RepID=UPI000B54796F|nr:hypothetical protein [Haliangium sp. UPWRP_2]